MSCKPLIVIWLLVLEHSISLNAQSCRSDVVSLYKITFEGLWVKEKFPKVYPISRPKAEWSSVIGRSHSSTYRMFNVGELVDSKLQTFVEHGDSTELDGEGQGSSVLLDAFSTSPLSQGYGEVSSQFFADFTRNKVSLAAKIVPSPDWFVGIDSFSLCQHGEWISSQEFELRPLDAGSQRGYTFSSPRWKSDPQEVITEITHMYPNHTADAFYYPELTVLPPIARVKLELVTLLTVSTRLESGKLQETVKHVLPSDTVKVAAVDAVRPPVPVFVKTTQPISEADSQTRTATANQMTRSSTIIRGIFQQTTTAQPETTPRINQQILQLLEEIRSRAESRESGVTTTGASSTTTSAPPPPQTNTVEILTDDEQDYIKDYYDEDEQGSGYDDYSIATGQTTSIVTESTRYEHEETNEILPPDSEEGIKYDDRLCIVSGWSDWTPCSRTCGYGVKTRSREVVSWTGNVACPELVTEVLCGSMKKCNWSHFSLTFNSTQSVVQNPKRQRIKKPMKVGNDGNRTAALVGNSGRFRSRIRGIPRP